MPSEITYNAGASYRVGKFKFKRGVTQTVSDPAVIDRCRKTVGFAVQDIVPPKPKPVKPVKPKKKVRAVATESAPSEEKPKKKTTSSKPKKRSYDE